MHKTYLILFILINSIFSQDIATMNIYNEYADVDIVNAIAATSNGEEFEWDKKQIDYLLIGDSFVHGACVNRPDDIASRLRLLSGKSVLNLGYFANGPLVEYAVLREYLMKDVKNILWIFYTED